MRSIGMDVHRSFAQVAIYDDGQITESFRVDMEHDAVVAFGRSLRSEDEVILEATGNTSAIVRLLTPFVNRVVIANPLQVKAIAHARVKTDKVDAKILAQLHAAGFLPEVWAADDETLHLRRLVSERDATVRSIRRVASSAMAEPWDLWISTNVRHAGDLADMSTHSTIRQSRHAGRLPKAFIKDIFKKYAQSQPGLIR